jgi:putative hemolysin
MINTQLLQLFDFKNLIPKEWVIKFSPRFMTYYPTHEMNIETPNYRLKTATTTEELTEVFELRFQIFLENTEFGQESGDQYDIDQFDSICDHIIIIDKANDQVVGTYRVMTNNMTNTFYSENEFELSALKKKDGIKMELGRACIHHGHRNGHVIDLLWKGIAKYVQLSGAKYLFGCSSVKTTEPETAKCLQEYFNRKNSTDFINEIESIGKFQMDLSNELISEDQIIEAKSLIPPLLKSYLSAGAQVCPSPALDEEFECIDFLTVLDLDNLSRLFKKRYFS